MSILLAGSVDTSIAIEALGTGIGMNDGDLEQQRRELVLFVGRVNDPAWKAHMQWLRDASELVCCATVSAAEKWLLDTRRFPGTVVFGQPRRDFFDTAGIQRVAELLPMARLVSLEGSWCEGSARSGQPYEGLQRWYWHQFQPRMAYLLGAGSLSSGNRTETEHERAIEVSRQLLPRGSGLLGIAARSLVTYESIDHACRLAGYRTSWLRPGTVDVPTGLRAIIADAEELSDAESLLDQLPEKSSQIPRIVLANFPRLADVKKLSRDGRTRVLAKPFRLHDLLWLLAECVDHGKVTRAA